MHIDHKVRQLFDGKIKQVFLYITNNCQLQCKHCLYKTSLKKNKEMDIATLLPLIKIFRNMGAFKLSLLGGEPTTYDCSNQNEKLFSLINEAKQAGYSYIRIDTNGQFAPKLLYHNSFKMLDEITFSLDGHEAHIHDQLRGPNVFEKCVENIRLAVKLKYNVHITSCIHKGCLQAGKLDLTYLESMIGFASDLGVNVLNLHPIIKVGVPRDNWIENTDISPYEWMLLYDKLRRNIDNGKYNIEIRVPERFVAKNHFMQNESYYDYCPVKMGERALIDGDGLIRICAFWIGINVGVAKFDNSGVKWLHENNEIDSLDNETCSVCVAQSKHYENIVPLCMSFKPKQNEMVWNSVRQIAVLEAVS